MSFRFRKSFGVGPFKTTISKSGVSTSFGVKGARVTKKADGKVQTTFSIPNTGLSYTTSSSNKNKNVTNTTINSSDNYKILHILFRILSIPMVILGLLLIIVNPVIGVCGAGIGIGEWILASHFKKKRSE